MKKRYGVGWTAVLTVLILVGGMYSRVQALDGTGEGTPYEEGDDQVPLYQEETDDSYWDEELDNESWKASDSTGDAGLPQDESSSEDEYPGDMEYQDEIPE